MPEACAGPRTAHAREPAPLSSLLPALRPLCGSPPPTLRGGLSQAPPHPPSARPQAARAQQPRRPSRPAPREGPGPQRHPGPPRARAGTAPAWCPPPRPAPRPARLAPGYSPPGEAGPAAGCPSTWPRLCAPEPAAGAPQRPASRRERPPPAPGPAPRQPRPRAAAAAQALPRAAPGWARGAQGAEWRRAG